MLKTAQLAATAIGNSTTTTRQSILYLLSNSRLLKVLS